MTTTSTEELQKSQEALAAAEEQASQARREHDAATARAEAERLAATDKFEAERGEAFYSTYDAAVDHARTAFEAALTSGGDVTTAWLAYQRAQAVARAEAEAIGRWRHRKAYRAHQAWETLIRDWNARLRAILVQEARGYDQEALAALNAEISARTAERGRPAERGAGDKQRLVLSDFSNSPGPIFSLEARVERRYSDTDFAAAVNRISTREYQAATREHEQARDAELARLT